MKSRAAEERHAKAVLTGKEWLRKVGKKADFGWRSAFSAAIRAFIFINGFSR
jgi:hypothetical protein